MMDVFAYVIAGALFGIPVILLGLAIRHFIPLMRGFKAPWWAGILGLFAYADRFIEEAVRPHRKKCLGYTVAFVAWCLILMVVAEAAK
jgi:sugar phosphate permease